MTDEKILDNEKFSEEVLDDEELEQVAGGTFTPNRYGIKNYKRAHIKVVKHFFAKNEFWWKGQDIGHDNANAITFFYNKTRKHAETLEEALQFRDDHYWDYHLLETPACFIGNSKISTPNGEKFIKDIKIGDEVISLDAENKKVVSKVIEVRPVFENEIVKVEFSNGKIWFTTATQWFYCGNDDYACVLEDKGKSAITEENAKATVVKVTKTGEIKKVYDFIVEGVNVFFVEGIAAEGYSVD